MRSLIHLAGLVLAAFIYVVLFCRCGGSPSSPPTSLACSLTREPPVWYEVQVAPAVESLPPLPPCLVVGGKELAMSAAGGQCCPKGRWCAAPGECPAEEVCITKRGGQALLVDKDAFESWTTEVWLRCRAQR